MMGERPLDNKQRLVLESLDKLKAKVLDFIETVKSCRANPFDYATKQSVNVAA